MDAKMRKMEAIFGKSTKASFNIASCWLCQKFISSGEATSSLAFLFDSVKLS